MMPVRICRHRRCIRGLLFFPRLPFQSISCIVPFPVSSVLTVFLYPYICPRAVQYRPYIRLSHLHHPGQQEPDLSSSFHRRAPDQLHIFCSYLQVFPPVSLCDGYGHAVLCCLFNNKCSAVSCSFNGRSLTYVVCSGLFLYKIG